MVPQLDFVDLGDIPGVGGFNGRYGELFSADTADFGFRVMQRFPHRLCQLPESLARSSSASPSSQRLDLIGSS